jgi:hypothetical protein
MHRMKFALFFVVVVAEKIVRRMNASTVKLMMTSRER